MKKILLAVVCLICFSKLGVAQAIFPQFADGVFPDGSFYKSTIVVQSYDPTVTQSCTLQLNGPIIQHFTTGTGQVLSTNANNQLSFTVKNLGFQILQSPGTAPISSGYASLACNGTNWNAFVIFSLYSATGVKLSEATVFSSPTESAGNSSASQLIVDEREGARLGIALVNASSSSVAQYTVAVTDVNGAQLGSLLLTLGPNTSLADFLDTITGTYGGFSLPANFVGQVTIVPMNQSAGPSIYAIGLRFTGPLFTTVPVSKCFSGNLCAN